MEADIADVATPPNAEPYSSRPGALVWFFRKSRDGWKRKHHQLQAKVKAYRNCIRDLTKSRDQWKLKAEQAAARLADVEAEVTRLRADIAAGRKKNSTRTSAN
jgi:chromosome segregation ATPase